MKKKSIVVRGFCMGTADIIPGVSGGTVALVLGIYERLLAAIRGVTPKSLWNLAKALPKWKTNPKDLQMAAVALDLGFLIPLGIGIVAAILTASRVIPYLMQTYPEPVEALFLGLILASVAVPIRQMKERRWYHLVIGLLFAVFTWWLTSVVVLKAPVNMVGYFFGGAFAISAMILPGLSGSYLLKMAGLYEPVLLSLKSASALDPAAIVMVLVFIAGIATGLPIFVRILLLFLKSAHCATMAALSGLMVGALGSVWPWKLGRAPRLPTEGDPILWPIVLFVVGLLIVGSLIYVEAKEERQETL